MQPASKSSAKHILESEDTILDNDITQTTMNPKPELPRVRTRSTKVVGFIYATLIVIGLGTGYILSVETTKGGLTTGNTASSGPKKVVGSADTQTFNDSAEGTVEKGGIDTEGTHKLVNRPENPTQPACLISSVLDLDEYIGKTIKVWGKTEAGKKCAWFMDVGRVEL